MNEVSGMGLLPQALQRSIRMELSAKHLKHPLLRWWFVMDPKAVQEVCHNAVDFASLAEDDHLFFPRTEASGAHVMTSGAAIYIRESAQAFNKVSIDSNKFTSEVHKDSNKMS